MYIVSVFSSKVKLSILNHDAQVVVLNSDFFKQKMMTTSIQNQKEIPGCHKLMTLVNSPCTLGAKANT